MNNYLLHIADESGEIELDFPSLDSNQKLARIEFECLGLLEKDGSPKSNNSFKRKDAKQSDCCKKVVTM